MSYVPGLPGATAQYEAIGDKEKFEKELVGCVNSEIRPEVLSNYADLL